MNILMISALDLWSLNGKGGSPSLYETLKGYDDREHQIFFLTSKKGSFDPYYQEQGQASFPNVRVHRFYLPLGSLPAAAKTRPSTAIRLNRFRQAFLFPPLAAIAARRISTTAEIDLLYGYEVHGILTVSILRRFYSAPCVARYQGTILHPCLGRRTALWRRFEHVAAMKAGADLYLMADDGTRGDEVLRALNPAAVPRTRFWRNGVDTISFRPRSSSTVRRELGIDAGLLLLAVGRLHHWKRVDRIIRALPPMVAKNADVVLAILGDGPERQKLQSLATDLGVAQHIRFEGAVRHDRVADYLNAADVFVSLYDLSNLGNPLLEAMACGKCIVTLDDGSTQGLLEDGQSALLLPQDRLDTLPQVILALHDDPELRQRLGRAAKASAEQHLWTWEERMQTEVEEVEKLVLNRAKRAE